MKNNGLVTRVISGAVLVIVLVILGIIGSVPLLVFTAAVSLIGLMELYKALGLYDKNAEDKKKNALAVTGLVGSIIFYICILTGFFTYLVYDALNISVVSIESLFSVISSAERLNTVVVLSNMTLALMFMLVMLVIFMGIYVFTFPRFSFEKVAYAFISIVYVSVFMSCIYLTRCLDNGKYIFWLIFICSWVCDTCAYFVGSSIGKHKLAPVLSPKKSIEGSIGGIAGSVIVAFVFGYFVEYKLFCGNNHAVVYMIICFLGSIVSQIGDLAASGIKRNHDIKDYGNIIPGHGGIMDRFDSVIFVAPVIYVLAAFII